MPFISAPPGTSGGGGGSGTVTNVSSPDTSIVVTNPTTTPSLKLATLDVIATNEPAAASVPLNAQKITDLANGAGAQDAAAFGQIPTALPPNGAAGGDLAGTYPSPTVAAGAVTVAKLAAAVTLDSIATAHATAAAVAMNAKKITGLAAATAATDAASLANTLDQFAAPAANVAFNAKKITGLANGAGAQDAAAFGQIPTALPPNGAAGGDLAGTYPNPTIAAAKGCRVFNSANLATTSGTFTLLTFDSEVFDTDTMHSTVTNTGRITFITAGIYTLVGNVDVDVSALGTVRSLAIKVNGTTFVAIQQAPGVGASFDARLTVAVTLMPAANDYAELYFFQDTGGSLNLIAASAYSPYFSAALHK